MKIVWCNLHDKHYQPIDISSYVESFAWFDRQITGFLCKLIHSFFYREANCFATILFLWFIAEFFVVLPIQLTFFVCVTRKSNSNANKNIISSEYMSEQLDYDKFSVFWVPLFFAIMTAKIKIMRERRINQTDTQTDKLHWANFHINLSFCRHKKEISLCI